MLMARRICRMERGRSWNVQFRAARERLTVNCGSVTHLAIRRSIRHQESCTALWGIVQWKYWMSHGVVHAWCSGNVVQEKFLLKILTFGNSTCQIHSGYFNIFYWENACHILYVIFDLCFCSRFLFADVIGLTAPCCLVFRSSTTRDCYDRFGNWLKVIHAFNNITTICAYICRNTNFHTLNYF
jgi:hypothetical protein